jgi:hypothetical protein
MNNGNISPVVGTLLPDLFRSSRTAFCCVRRAEELACFEIILRPGVVIIRRKPQVSDPPLIGVP